MTTLGLKVPTQLPPGEVEAGASTPATTAEEGSEGSCSGAEAGEPAPDGSSPWRPVLGDLVVLGPGAPQEFRQRTAIVTETAKTHCTVAVLDESGRFGVGECWPNVTDMLPKSQHLRLDSHVLIDGLKGAKTRRLNGRYATLVVHSREGHPSFVQTKASPEQPQLTVCVRLDEPLEGSSRTVLLEPRFLVVEGHQRAF